jgi:radical SAM protein with 4Fe4S-binding SPASM domain
MPPIYLHNVTKKEPVDLKELLSNKKFIPIYSSRKNLDERELGPVAVELHWTSICNYNCIHCSYGNRRQYREKLSYETIHSVIKDLIALQVKGVYLSGGGEPTTVTGWDKYAFELISNGVKVALITNGVKVAEVHLDVLRKMNYVAVSLYSTEENEYEEITGGKVFEKQFLLPSLLKKEPEDAVIGARCVLNKINYRKVVSIYQRAMKAGFDYIIFIPVVDYEGTGIDLQQEEMLSLHDILINNYDQFNASKTNVDNLIMRKSHYYDVTDYRESLRDPQVGCRAIQIRGNAFINYDGGVYLCQPHIGDERYCIGNINEMKLIEIWNSSLHLEVIDRLNQNFASGLCKNCRSIGFNKAADEYDQGQTTVPATINDFFI